MKAFASFFARAALTAGLAGFFAPAALAAQGQSFPGVTCTCKGCASGGGDLTGDLACAKIRQCIRRDRNPMITAKRPRR